MPDEQKNSSRSISKTDVFSSAALTGVITFVLLTWAKNISNDSMLRPYLNEETISFLAGLISFILTNILSYVRYEIKFIVHERNYTKKVKYLDNIITRTTCPKTLAKLEKQKNDLLISAAKQIVDQEI